MELTASPKNTQVAEAKFRPDDKVRLSICLGEELVGLRAYGKTGDDIPAITELFLKKFSQYEPAKVINAIEQWGLTGTGDFPTPPDIEAILNPKPKFDHTVYRRLLDLNKSGDRLTSTQWEYIKLYEQNSMKGF